MPGVARSLYFFKCYLWRVSNFILFFSVDLMNKSMLK